MLYKPAICLAALLCVAVTTLSAQPIDSLTGKLAGFPTRVFGKIGTRSADLNRQLTRQTEKYLARMGRLEQQLHERMVASDSGAAKALFAGTRQRYAALAAQLKAGSAQEAGALSGEYIPFADTLQGAMGFLQQHPEMLTKATDAVNGSAPAQVQGKLVEAADKFHALQSELKNAEMVKAYVQSRQQVISQYVAAHTALAGVLSKQVADIRRENYYFSQRVRAYESELTDPDALTRRALAMLARLSSFQTFMKSHSQLGSLFQVPGNYGTAQATAGLQTREQVAGIVQQQLAAGGPPASEALQSKMQSAQSQLDGYKNRLSKLGAGNGDAPLPDFSPNNEKIKSFLGRLQYGFNLQTTHNSYYYPSLLSLGLSLGYKLGHDNVVGVGLSYEAGTGNGIRDIRLTSNGIGIRSFATIKIRGSFSASAGFEYNRTTPFASYQQLKQLSSWQKSGLVGVTKVVSLKSKLLKQTTASLLWDFLSGYQTPHTQPIIFRVGYTW